MLQEIMRKGSSSLGTDVPSEREINRLAARSEEEFWMFEKMDEERRQKENYRARLMEDHEVPDWAYVPTDKDSKSKRLESNISNITGKRKRKEVVYADTLSEQQWIRAVENAEDLSRQQSARGKQRREQKFIATASEFTTNNSDNAAEEEEEEEEEDEQQQQQRATETNNEPAAAATSSSLFNEATSGNRIGLRVEFQDGENSSGVNPLGWKPHKRKRSSFSIQSLSNSRS